MKIEKFIHESAIFKTIDIYKETFAQIKETLAPLDLNFNEALIITALYFEKDSIIFSKDLSKSLGFSKSFTAQTLTSLEKKGFIKRQLSANDTRMSVIKLTSKGKRPAINAIKVIEKSDKACESRLMKYFATT